MSVTRRYLDVPVGFHAAYVTDDLLLVDQTFDHAGEAYAPARHNAMLFDRVAKKLEGAYVPFPEGVDNLIYPTGIKFSFRVRPYMILFSQPHDLERPTLICVEEDVDERHVELAARKGSKTFLRQFQRLYSNEKSDENIHA